MTGSTLMEVNNVNVIYELKERNIKAVRNVSLTLREGEIIGIVGESGSGKSTLAMTFLNLVMSPGRITNGSIIYYGNRSKTDVLKLKPSDLRRFRWKEISMIFQGAMNSLNPVMRIEDQIMDVMIEHGYDPSDSNRRVGELLKAAGVSEKIRSSYQHELSGGMKQRVNIAMALACDPKILIADEATTALDVLIQRLILLRLLKLKEERGISIVFITHDVSLVANIADRIYVMYAGKIVEGATVESLFEEPKHPYTKALLNSIPSLEKGKAIRGIPGTPPDLSNDIKYCPFAERCPEVFQRCREEEPGLVTVGKDHIVSCHLYSK